MGLVKTRRLAAMQKQQRAKAATKPPMKGGAGKGVPHIPRGRRPSREAVARGVQFAPAAPKASLKAF